jgi:hypothetical protein
LVGNPAWRAADEKSLFLAGNQFRHQMFEMQGTLCVAAAQQILNTISAETAAASHASGI